MVEAVVRRRFRGYVLAAPILVTAADLAVTPTATTEDLLGLNDIRTAVALPASRLISIEVHPDWTVTLVVPRATSREALATSVTLITQELSVPRERVDVALGDAPPDAAYHQVTTVRVAVAVARRRLLEAASAAFGSSVADLRLAAGAVADRVGHRLDIGALAAKAASTSTVAVAVELPG
ncbi:isoquinoline 1-oxidoreductase [Hamadaea sp. NPDC051192]|uniref:isoquinoline 1-oxidoreductase n=1 Tax=Hamadaea sp. NPDC051192 TaxID=3154940 RepID=UPI00342EA87B